MKAKERIERYGIEAFLKSLGKEAVKKRGGRKALLKFYTEKYIGVPVGVEPSTKGRISWQMKSYWKDVKLIMEGHKIGVVEARKLMKKEGAGRDVTLRVIKVGDGWQLLLWGDYENPKTKKELIEYAEKHEINIEEYLNKNKFSWRAENVESYSYAHAEKDFDECLIECVRKAQGMLGGSNWELVEVVKYHWNRFYGREK